MEVFGDLFSFRIHLYKSMPFASGCEAAAAVLAALLVASLTSARLSSELNEAIAAFGEPGTVIFAFFGAALAACRTGGEYRQCTAVEKKSTGCSRRRCT